MARLLSVVSVLLGLLGLAAAYLVWTDYQGELRRISSELAQMKVSVQLLAQRPVATEPGTAEPAPVEDADAKAIEDLTTRIAALEEAAKAPAMASTAPASADDTTVLAALPPAESEAAPEEGDCIPQGTRFVLTPGDGFKVCGATASLTLQEVGEGIAEIAGVGPLTQGTTGKLNGSSCSVALLSTMVDGFAEVRVSC